jgi:hypothetical protein
VKVHMGPGPGAAVVPGEENPLARCREKIHTERSEWTHGGIGKTCREGNAVPGYALIR